MKIPVFSKSALQALSNKKRRALAYPFVVDIVKKVADLKAHGRFVWAKEHTDIPGNEWVGNLGKLPA